MRASLIAKARSKPAEENRPKMYRPIVLCSVTDSLSPEHF
jgi:hypothetical protein